MASLGQGISGGDRIYIELARNWSSSFKVNIFVWEEGLEMCNRQKLSGKHLKMHLIKVGIVRKLGFFITYFYRIYLGIRLGFILKPDSNSMVYSASEFWMDALPALILKIRFPNIIWTAAWYQTAPNPLIGFAENPRDKAYKFQALLYWLMQLPIKPLIARYADYILVNNELERNNFRALNVQKRVLVMIGAVNLELIKKYKEKNRSTILEYDAVFQGRFHPQKGVEELVRIWKIVVNEIPDAKLLMIGDGPLMSSVRLLINDLNLNKNIILCGYVYDGDKKYKIFSRSKMVVHPAFYDSGGMAAAEAMAFGIPCIGFNLKSYNSYYPKGMIKTRTNTLNGFANEIIKVLRNEKLRKQIGKDAEGLIYKSYSWSFRSEEIIAKIHSKR